MKIEFELAQQFTVRAIACLSLLILSGATAHAANPCVVAGPSREVMTPATFFTGQKYIALDNQSRALYLMGVIDGFFYSALFGAPEQCAMAQQKCVLGRNNLQLVAIVDKYIRNNPEKWHYSANTLIHTALFLDCLNQ